MNALKKKRIKTVMKYTWPFYIVAMVIIILFMDFIFGVTHRLPSYKMITLFVSGDVKDYVALRDDLLEEYEEKELQVVSTISSFPNESQYNAKLTVSGYASADIFIIPVSTLDTLRVASFALQLNEEIIATYYQNYTFYQKDEEKYGVKLDKEKVKQYMSLPDEECYMLLNFGSDNIGQYALKPNQEHDTALQLVKKWGM